MAQQQQTLSIVNDSGNLIFNGGGYLRTDCKNLNVLSKGALEITGNANSFLKTVTGDITVQTDTDSINIISKKTSSNSSINLEATQTGGGIKLTSDYGGITQFATGNIDVNAKNADINLGVFAQGVSSDQTNNIIMEANSKITTSSTDFEVVTSDAINLISLTGDISLGSSVGTSFFKFYNNNLLLNQTTSTYDKQLDIKLTDEASSQPGYNGILVNSSNVQVAADITLQTSDSNAAISLGVQPANSKYSYYQEYTAYQTGTSVIPISGPTLTNADIGRRVYFTSTDAMDTISALGTTVLSADNTYATLDLTSGGTYTGSTNKIYRIEIDSVGTPDTFRWSNDAGNTYSTTYKTVTTGSAITLEEGVTITFSATTGHTLGDYWTFCAKITATVGTSRSIANSEKMYTLQDFGGYLKTSNISDIQVQTAGTERMRLTADGSLGIGTAQPSSTLQITNNVGKGVVVNEYNTNYQLNPAVGNLQSGGYVVVWESKGQDGDDYGIYGQQYMADGSKFGSQYRVNVTTAGHQSHPHVAGRRIANSKDYIVVWASEESDGSGVYDIYAQVYINGSPKKATDIQVSVVSSTKELYPRVAGLTNGKFLVTWASYDSGASQYKVYGKYVDILGNVSSLNVNGVSDNNLINSSTDYSVTYPHPFGISSSDATIPGGFGVVFMNEYASQDTDNAAVNNDDRYNIQYRLFNSSAVPQISDTDVTDSTSNNLTITDGLVSAIGLDDGGFAFAFYRNFEGKTSIYKATDSIDGVTSGVQGSIVSVSGSTIVASLNSVNDRLLVGEEIKIENLWYEKIEAVTHDGGNIATITLSKGHRSISLFKYNTNSVTPVLNNIKVNTTDLVADAQRSSLTGVEHVRNTTIFNYKFPLASIAELEDNNLAVVWSNGKIPSVYYQLISISDGSKIGSETLIDSSYTNLKQRSPSIAGIKTIEGLDAGLAIAWDVEAQDSGASGIYQTIINPNNYLVRIHNAKTEMVINNDGKMGVGTKTPSDKLHVYSAALENSNVVIQTGGTDIDTNGGVTNIKFMDGSKQLGLIKGGYSDGYQKLNPNFDNLVAYYSFDESPGSNALSDLSKNKYDGRIVNFDVYTDWKTGKINKCLEFNGTNNHCSLGVAADLNSLTRSSSGYTITTWVKVPTNITTSASYDIISNNGDTAITGTYVLTVSDTGGNNNAKVSSIIVTADGAQTINSSATVNDDNWHLVGTVYHASNTTLQTYVDGTISGELSITGAIASSPTSNVYIGSRNGSSNYYRGLMDELRVYDTAFTYEELQKVYKYGSQTRGKMVFTTQGGNDVLPDSTHGFTLDDTGRVQGLQHKGHNFSRLTGQVSFNNTNTLVTGTGTAFDTEVQVGDTINFSSTSLVVTSIDSETKMNVNLASSNTITSKVIRKPAILTMFDVNDNLLNLVDYQGNMILGGTQPSSKLEIRGTGNSSDLPYLTLSNTTDEDIESGRETRVIFKGNNGGTTQTLGYFDVSHSGTGNDTKGKMRFFINDGSNNNAEKETLVVKDTGDIGIGHQVSPLGRLHVAKESSNCNIILSSGSSHEKVYGEASEIYFIGKESYNNTNNLATGSLAMIRGSSDYNADNVSGRCDIFTNYHTDSLGLQSRLSITSEGYVGVSITEPANTFQASPIITPTTAKVASQSGTTVTLSSGTVTDDDIIGGMVVFNNDTQTSRKITARPSNTQLTVGTSGTVSAAPISVYYPGLSVTNTGRVAVGTTTATSRFHVEGAISTAIKNITFADSPYTVTIRDSTLIGDATDGNITINIPTSGCAGRIYVIKKISSSHKIDITPISGTIDGASVKHLNGQYKYMKVQSDGTNLHIIGDN
jgi:hypothetical protein